MLKEKRDPKVGLRKMVTSLFWRMNLDGEKRLKIIKAKEACFSSVMKIRILNFFLVFKSFILNNWVFLRDEFMIIY